MYYEIFIFKSSKTYKNHLLSYSKKLFGVVFSEDSKATHSIKILVIQEIDVWIK